MLNEEFPPGAKSKKEGILNVFSNKYKKYIVHFGFNSGKMFASQATY